MTPDRPAGEVEELEARLAELDARKSLKRPRAHLAEAMRIAANAIAALRRLREENEGRWPDLEQRVVAGLIAANNDPGCSGSALEVAHHVCEAIAGEPAARPNTNAGNPVRSQQGVTDGQERGQE